MSGLCVGLCAEFVFRVHVLSDVWRLCAGFVYEVRVSSFCVEFVFWASQLSPAFLYHNYVCYTHHTLPRWLLRFL